LGHLYVKFVAGTVVSGDYGPEKGAGLLRSLDDAARRLAGIEPLCLGIDHFPAIGLLPMMPVYSRMIYYNAGYAILFPAAFGNLCFPSLKIVAFYISRL